MSSFRPFGAHPYRMMFILMVAIIVAAVMLPVAAIGGLLYDYMVAAILLLALLETTRTRRHALIALAVGLPAVVARLLTAHTPDSAVTNSPALLLSILFIAFMIWNLLRDLLTGDRAIGERIFGALTAYLLMGILFALVFAHIQFLDDGAFSVAGHLSAAIGDDESLMLPVFTYFSFVTLTTLGYGDVTPITEQARTLAWFEAFIGQIFLAVMVGGLVGVYFAERSRSEGAGAAEASEKPGERDNED